MNCKPGDLAVVVRAGPLTQDFLGRLVTVKRPGPDLFVDGIVYASWEYEPELRNSVGVVQAIEDACLRPIRDPGDDARDQTLNWLPAPTKETA
jgi:hypothetical protein